MSVYTDEGEPLDKLAVATEDMLLTVCVRLDLIDDDSLSWLAVRCLAHAEECAELPERAEVFRAMVRYIEAIQRSVP